jgi:hypothetical protein
MKGHLNIYAVTAELIYVHCQYACIQRTGESRLVDYAVTHMQLAELLSAFVADIES